MPILPADLICPRCGNNDPALFSIKAALAIGPVYRGADGEGPDLEAGPIGAGVAIDIEQSEVNCVICTLEAPLREFLLR